MKEESRFGDGLENEMGEGGVSLMFAAVEVLSQVITIRVPRVADVGHWLGSCSSDGNGMADFITE
jgi:hypothetical protein